MAPFTWCYEKKDKFLHLFWISNVQYLKFCRNVRKRANLSFQLNQTWQQTWDFKQERKTTFDRRTYFLNFRSLWRRAARRQDWLVRTTVRSTKPNLLKMAPKWVTWWLCARGKKRRLLPNLRRSRNLPLFPPSLGGEQTNYNKKNHFVFQKITIFGNVALYVWKSSQKYNG